jgi:hypothetical protein
VAWDDTFANRVRDQIERHQEVDGDDLTRFLAMVDEAVTDQQRPRAEPSHPWSDQQAHDVYTRIHHSPDSVTAEEAQEFWSWAQTQQRQAAGERGHIPPVPAADASVQERHAYILACQRANQAPDPATVAAFAEQVNATLTDATRELESRYPPGLFERPPTAPDEDAMRQELWGLVEQQRQDPNSVSTADWHAAYGRLGALTDQHAADTRGRQLPWVLPADQARDPGVEPGAVEAMTAPAPWTPRQPTETEQTLAELGQLDHEIGDDAA